MKFLKIITGTIAALLFFLHCNQVPTPVCQPSKAVTSEDGTSYTLREILSEGEYIDSTFTVASCRLIRETEYRNGKTVRETTVRTGGRTSPRIMWLDQRQIRCDQFFSIAADNEQITNIHCYSVDEGIQVGWEVNRKNGLLHGRYELSDGPTTVAQGYYRAGEPDGLWTFYVSKHQNVEVAFECGHILSMLPKPGDVSPCNRYEGNDAISQGRRARDLSCIVPTSGEIAIQRFVFDSGSFHLEHRVKGRGKCITHGPPVGSADVEPLEFRMEE